MIWTVNWERKDRSLSPQSEASESKDQNKEINTLKLEKEKRAKSSLNPSGRQLARKKNLKLSDFQIRLPRVKEADLRGRREGSSKRVWLLSCTHRQILL